MKRIAAITALLVATSAVALAGLGAGEEGGVYKVRAIFDNAAFVIPGEDVKVAGVRVGAIDAVDVTDDFRAAVTLAIEEPAYQDFRQDAECIIRPQSLIGEKFVECEPTQERAAGTEPPPALERIEEGEGEGEYLLPVENTRRSVDLDLINTIYREPYAKRFTIILNELGVGLAGRGKDLNDVIKRAAPALTELDEVLAILARQNRTLRALAADSDTALAPLARDREHVTGFIENASEVAEATAERREALQASIERLPRFLRELRPTMTRLEGLTEEATPVLADLHSVAPEVNAFIQDLGPFSEAAIPAVETLGDAALVGTPALEEALPITRDLREAAKPLRPVADLLGKILTSLDQQRGFQRILDYIYFQVAAVNGFDSFGHYLRAALLVNTCSGYALTPVPGCLAKFSSTSASASAASADMPRDPHLERVRRILAGESPEDVLGEERAGKNSRKLERMLDAVRRYRETNEPIQQAPAGTPPATSTEPGGAAPAPTPEPSGSGAASDETDTLLDYLFGGPE